MQNDYIYTVTQEQMITITCEYIQQPLQRCACTSKASPQYALTKTDARKMHRYISAGLTDGCLNRHLVLKGQRWLSATHHPHLWVAKQKNTEKKQPCKRKDDCFIPEHKIQAKTLGENEKNFSSNQKKYSLAQIPCKSSE